MPDAPLLPGYRFDPTMRGGGQYRDLRTGRTVARARIVELLDAQVQQRADRLARLTMDFASNQLPARDWLNAMKDELRRAAIQNRAIGSGGFHALTSHDYGVIGAQLKESYRRLAGFAEAIARGEVSEAQALARLNGYMGMARWHYWDAQKERASVPSKPGLVVLARRRLGVAEHCFPAGTLIMTADGEKPIEAINEGDLVVTQVGLRRVTRLFIRPYAGDMITLVAGQRNVTCTANHPFLTARGWIAAGNLRMDDRVMLHQDGLHEINRKVRFPYTDYGISTSSQVGILGGIASFLGKLPFPQWLKSRMAMPPIAICLNDEFAETKVNDEFGLDEDLRLIRDVQSLQDRGQMKFEFGWSVTKHLRVAFNKSSDMFRTAAIPTKVFTRLWSLRRIMFRQIITCGTMNRFSIDFRVKYDAKMVSSVLNSGARPIRQQFDARVRSTGRESLSDNRIFFICPAPSDRIMVDTVQCLTVSGKSTSWTRMPGHSFLRKFCRAASLAKIGLAIFAMPANRTHFLSAFCGADPSDQGTSTFYGTNPSAFVCRHRGIANFAWFSSNRLLHNDNAPRVLYNNVSESQNLVYNLEVDEAHHYIANGFVVHNCDSCIIYARAGWRPIEYVPSPGEPGSSECNGSCRCSREIKEVLADEAAGMVGGGGLPEWNASEALP